MIIYFVSKVVLIIVYYSFSNIFVMHFHEGKRNAKGECESKNVFYFTVCPVLKQQWEIPKNQKNI